MLGASLLLLWKAKLMLLVLWKLDIAMLSVYLMVLLFSGLILTTSTIVLTISMIRSRSYSRRTLMKLARIYGPSSSGDFGAEVCYTVDLGDKKDINEVLVDHGVSGVKHCIDGASEVPLDNVVQLKDIEDEITEFIEEGFKPGYQIGITNFDDIFSTYTGQFITVTGIPSSGKERTGWIKWRSDTTKNMDGGQHLQVRKINQHFFMRTNLSENSGKACRTRRTWERISGKRIYSTY